MYKSRAVGVVYVLPILLFSGIHADGISTCEDLQRKIASYEDEIENLKFTLEEYKLASGGPEDKSDECNGYETCTKCLRETTNPSCGWCFQHNRCSFQENCIDDHSNSDLWISGSDKCPKIRGVKPHLIVEHTVTMLQIIIPHLPQYDGIFLCSFEMLGRTLLTTGSKKNTGVACPSPHTDRVPEIPKNNDHLSVKISIRLPNGPNFASTSNFTIFSCNHYASCSECAASPFPCAWCVGSNRCTHDVDENCRNDVIVFSKAVARPTMREGSGYCSRVLSGLGGNEIFIHSGTKRRIYAKVENIMQFQVTSRFVCEVKGVGRETGQLLGDTVYCDEMLFKVLNRNPVSNLTFAIYWGNGNGKMDNTENLHVVVYHCGLMASSCGECLDLPDQYHCGWCEESNSCAIRDNCGEPGWMDKTQTCTKPEITSFFPRSGLETRKTIVTIKGINFARKFQDIERVKLVNEAQDVSIECSLLEHLFVKHSQVGCLLDVPDFSSERNGTLQGFFEVKISNSFVAISEDEFSFVDPSITGFTPVKGIKSGGTLLNIEGEHLDAGNKVEVFVGDLPCNIISRELSTIRCITSASPRTRSGDVRVIFDEEAKTSSAYFFYVEDPFIRSVKSELGRNTPTGTPSGGNLVTVEGDYFDHVLNPYMVITIGGVDYPGACEVVSDKRMDCFGPRLPADALNFCGEEGSLYLDYGFRMGDAPDVQNISLDEKFGKFRIHPDPFFMPFTEEGMKKIYKSNYLVINGRYLDTVFDEEDITVQIGDGVCILTSLSHNQLSCKPPAIQRTVGSDNTGNKLPEVVVRIRDMYKFFIGFLQYNDN